jgi:hypothetical protein
MPDFPERSCILQDTGAALSAPAGMGRSAAAGILPRGAAPGAWQHAAVIPDPPPKPPKPPEQLAAELEARVRDEARRDAAWRARRRRYRVLALAVGAFLPAAAVAIAGGLASGTFPGWLAPDAGLRPVALASASGLAPTALQVWRGAGPLAGVVLHGAAFAAFVALAGKALAILLPLLFLLLALFVATGALVGFIVGLEEEGG